MNIVAISQALDDDLTAAKRRVLRVPLRAQEASLGDKVKLLEKRRDAEDALRRMRRMIFDAEDAASAAIQAQDASLFEPFAEHFRKGMLAIRQHIAQAA